MYDAEATLELFGSSANGFGHCNSDLDLCLLMNEKYEVTNLVFFFNFLIFICLFNIMLIVDYPCC